MTDLLIENLAEIATPSGTTPRRGAEQGQQGQKQAGEGAHGGVLGTTTDSKAPAVRRGKPRGLFRR